MTARKTNTLAQLAVLVSGTAWGLYWLPLRALDGAGIKGLWAVLVFHGLPGLLLLPVYFARLKHTQGRTLRLLGLGSVAAISMVIYALSLLNTDVIRAIVLFYLMPVWSTLLERLVFGVRITFVRSLAIVLALLAIAILFGNAGWPLPRNTGDWLALVAGALWSTATILFTSDPNHDAVDLTTSYFVGAMLSLVVLLPFAGPLPDAPFAALASVPGSLFALVAIALVSVYASMWGVPKLPPGISGLLFMTEISAGAITSALWAGEPFGWRQLTGISLIAMAGGLENLAALAFRRRT